MYAKKIEWWAEKFSGLSEVGSFTYATVFVNIRIDEKRWIILLDIMLMLQSALGGN